MQAAAKTNRSVSRLRLVGIDSRELRDLGKLQEQNRYLIQAIGPAKDERFRSAHVREDCGVQLSNHPLLREFSPPESPIWGSVFQHRLSVSFTQPNPYLNIYAALPRLQ